MSRRNARLDVPVIDLSDDDIIIISDDEEEATTSGSDSHLQELQRNTQSRVVPVEIIPVVLQWQERSVGTVPRVVPSVHQSSRSWTTRPQASNFHVGESSRQAERRGFTNMRPSGPHNAPLRAVPPHFNPAQQYHQRLAEIYQESNPHRRQPISLPPHPTPPTIGAPPSLPLYPLAGGQPPLRPNTITAAAAASLTMTELVIAASRGNLPPAPQFTVEVHVPAPPMEQHRLPELDLQRARLIEEMQGTVDHFRRNGGLSPEEINNMANMMVDEQMQVSEEMDVDVDLMSYKEEYVNVEELARLPCSHQFHYNCIKQWLMQKNVCPICMATVCSEGN